MAEEKTKKETAKHSTEEKLAVIRIRSAPMQSKKVEDTFKKLKLMKPNYCVLVPKTPTYEGMIKKVAHLVTWGEADAETEKALEAKKEKGKKAIRLQPPKGGFERKGVKLPYKVGGASGYRGKDIKKLINKMLR